MSRHRQHRPLDLSAIREVGYLALVVIACIALVTAYLHTL